MEAVQAATGQGGWPMTVFLTPEAEPFYFGTYFPPAPRHGMPSFRQVLEGVATAWTDRRDEVTDVAGPDRARPGRRAASGYEQPQPPGPEELAAALLELTRDFDAAHGGFGGAPKFPPSMALEFLLRHHARTGSEGALEMVEATCEAMARGGIYDQLGGGFARYSVDAAWVVPHFEKMLYDNALLCRVYAHAWRGHRLGARHAGSPWRPPTSWCANWAPTRAGSPPRWTPTATTATAATVEGAYYVWTPGAAARGARRGRTAGGPPSTSA